MKNNKKMIIGILLISLITIITTISYALWQKYFTQTGENTTTTGCFNITYNGGEDVSLTEAIPITDEKGMEAIKPYEVTIENKCNSVVAYNVVLNKSKSSNLDDTHVKVTTGAVAKLLSNTEEVSTNTSVNGLTNYTNGTSNIISKSFVGPNETKKVKVKAWMDNATTQEEGENKIFSYKITIEATATNKIPELESINILGKNYPVINAIPDFSKGFPNESTSEEDKANLSGLYQSYDDDGDTYYFRGAVENNYVDFAGKTWRILRINGDGTIRLMLDEFATESQKFNTSSSGHKYVGYTYDNSSSCTNVSPCKSTYNSSSNSFTMTPEGTNSDMKSYLEQWYMDNLRIYDSKIATTTFCNDVSYGSGEEDSSNWLYYGPYDRLIIKHKPSLECPDPYKQGKTESRDYGGVYKLKIGLINADELNMGGYSWNSPYASTANFLRRNLWYWTLSPGYASTSFAFVLFARSDDSVIIDYGVYVTGGVAPVININAGTLSSSGDGTSGSPFKIN